MSSFGMDSDTPKDVEMFSRSFCRIFATLW